MEQEQCITKSITLHVRLGNQLTKRYCLLTGVVAFRKGKEPPMKKQSGCHIYKENNLCAFLNSKIDYASTPMQDGH